MKLLQELTMLTEEAIEVRPAAEVWKENKDKAKNFITNSVYMVRKMKDSDPVKYEVFLDKDNKRKSMGKVDTEELESLYVPIRAKQTEDAEGFSMYRDIDEVEAFKHDGDTIKVDLEDGQTEKLKKGDYLLRTTTDDSFVYTVETAKYFDRDYTEKS